MSTFELVSLIIGIVLLIARLILGIAESWMGGWANDTFRGQDHRTATGMSWPRPSNERRSPKAGDE